MIPKPSRAANHKTHADNVRFHKLKKLGCIACKIEWGEHICIPPFIHHCFTKMGKRKNHQHTISLCDEHHDHPGIVGYPSIHHHTKSFEAKYGTEAELLAKVNAILEKMG